MKSPFSVVFGRGSEVLDDRAFRVLLLVNLSPPLGTTLLSPLLETLTHNYAVSSATIGLVMTVYTAPSIVFIPVAGALSDRVGRKPVMLAGLLLFGAAGSGLAATSDFGTVLALRALQGVGFAALTPVIVTSIGDLYEGGREATAQGIRFAASGLTVMLLPPLAGVLVAVAWNAPFLLYLLAFPAALVAWRYFEEPTDDRAVGDGGGDRGAGDDVTNESPGDADPDGGTAALLRLAKRPRVAAILVGRAVPNFLFIAYFTYNSFVVVQAIHGSPGQAGLVVAVVSVGQTVAATQAGRITARFESRFWPLAIATVAMSAGLAVAGLAPSLPALLVGGVAMGLGFGVSLSLYRSVITGFSTSLRGGLVGLGSSLGRIAATGAPLALGAAIASLRTSLGFVPAVRWTLVGTAVGCLVVGLGSLLVARLSPPIEPEAEGGRRAGA